MLLDPSHLRFIIATTVAAVVATAAYVPYAASRLNGPSGGSWLGLVFGGLGFALMIYAGLLGARRKVPTWRLGRATTWMKGHLWLGLLSYLLILYHSGLAWGGTLTLVLMLLFTIVIASGIYGVLLQQFMPRLMTERLPLETVYEQIDVIVAQLRAEADALVGSVVGSLPVADLEPSGIPRGGGGLAHGEALAHELRGPATAVVPIPTEAEAAPLKDAYVREIRGYLARDVPRSGRLGNPRERDALFGHLRTLLPGSLHEIVDELRVICEERRQLALQKRLHHWLHGWLLVHVPLSMALLLLSAVHAIVSIRY